MSPTRSPRPPRSRLDEQHERWRRYGGWLLAFLLVSVAAHGLMGWLSLWLSPGGGLHGEEGFSGWGGPTVEIAVEGPRGQGGPTVPATPPTPPTPPAPPPEPPPEPHAPSVPTVHHHPPPRPPTPAPSTTTTAEQPSGVITTPQTSGTPNGTNAIHTSHGRSAGQAASVGAQRGRIGHAVDCDDPVAGVWEAFEFYPNDDFSLFGSWYRYTLTIHRGWEEDLTGEVTSNYWSGSTDDDHEPTSCTYDALFGRHTHGVVRMLGRGRADGLDVEFGGIEIASQRMICGLRGHYYRDVFSGRIDPTTHEFQSVNNDGGSAINEPTLFRRIRCVDE